MSNTENPNVQNPELETEDEGDTDLKVRTNLKAGDLALTSFYVNPLDLYGMKLSGGSRISSAGNTYG